MTGGVSTRKPDQILPPQASNGGAHLDPILDWARSGLGFIRDGIPASDGTRAGLDLDDLLSSSAAASKMSEKDKADLLAEARKMAEWTVLKKARSEVYLRLDLLRADLDEDAPTRGERYDDEEEEDWLDRSSLWQSFLSEFSPAEQARFAAAAAEQQQEGRRTGPGGDLEWAWWAAKETAGAAGKKGVVRAHQESAADAVRRSSSSMDLHAHAHRASMSSPRNSFGGGGGGGGGGGSSLRKKSGDFGGGGGGSTRRKSSFDRHRDPPGRKSSLESHRRPPPRSSFDSRRPSGETPSSRRPSLDFFRHHHHHPSSSSSSTALPQTDEPGAGGRLAVPPPEVETTRQTLLGRYVESVRGYLTTARQQQVR